MPINQNRGDDQQPERRFAAPTSRQYKAHLARKNRRSRASETQVVLAQPTNLTVTEV